MAINYFAIIYSSMIVWAIIPFRQYKTEYFIFFLILAISDPIVLTIYSVVHLNPLRIYPMLILLATFSLIQFNTIKKNLFLVILITFLSTYASIEASFKILKIILLVIHIAMFFIILKKVIIEAYQNDRIKIFYFVFCIYITSLIMKYLISIVDIKTGMTYFYLTSAFEILIGIYFIIYNVKNSPSLKLKFHK